MATFFERIQSLLSAPPTAAASAVSAAEAAANATMEKVLATPKHPYYPVEAEIVGYLTNEYDRLQLCSLFAAGCAVIFGVTYAVVKRMRPSIRIGDVSTMLWFTLCGCIHLFFEGYYIYNFRSMGPKQDLFGQLWKEYSKSDSRYLTADSAFVLTMESITAVCWGPLSFFTAFLIASDHPLRHPFQIIVSLGQLYGDVLYYATSLFDEAMLGLTYSRPEAAYYWGYFVFMNAFWIVIPLLLISYSVGSCRTAFEVLGRAGGLQNGSAKKRQ